MVHRSVSRLRGIAINLIRTTRRYGSLVSVHSVPKRASEIHDSISKPWLQISRSFCTDGPPNDVVQLDFKSYSKLATSPEMEKEIKMVLMEHELTKQANLRVPSTISEMDMERLLELPSTMARQKYFHFLGTKEFMILAEIKKKELRRKEMEQVRLDRLNCPPDVNAHLVHGLTANSMFPRIVEKSLHAFHMSRLCHAATFELPLIFDLSFDDSMTRREIQNTAEQIQTAYALNKRSAQPFDLCMCNLQPQSEMRSQLEKALPCLSHPKYMLTLEKRDYIDLYPKDKFVYLTPDALEPLKNFESDKIYIMGGIVDKSCSKPLTLAKAKRQGIKTAKLPIDQYLLWGLGSKSLTLNQVMAVLLEWKKSNDWNKALQFIPRRKLKTAEEVLEQEKRKLAKLSSKTQRSKFGTAFFAKTNRFETERQAKTRVKSLFQDD